MSHVLLERLMRRMEALLTTSILKQIVEIGNNKIYLGESNYEVKVTDVPVTWKNITQ